MFRLSHVAGLGFLNQVRLAATENATLLCSGPSTIEDLGMRQGPDLTDGTSHSDLAGAFLPKSQETVGRSEVGGKR